MRIVLVLPSRCDPAHRRVAAELGRALTGRGHAVYIFPPRDGLSPRLFRRRLERLLADKRIDICHVQFFSRGLGGLAGTHIPAGTRLVLTHQGACADLLEHPRAFTHLARRADCVTAVSGDGLADLIRRFPSIRRKSAVVFNGVELSLPAPEKTRPYILCVARLAAYKGIDILALAFAALAASDRSLKLIICGPDQTGGRLRGFIKRLGLGKRIRLLGTVSPARVKRLLRGSLFFVLPSRQENCPMALLEAMAAGKAVVATMVGGVPELVADNVNGLLVPPGDATALSRAMLKLLKDARLRARLGRAARARARRFAWPVIAEHYERLYHIRPSPFP